MMKTQTALAPVALLALLLIATPAAADDWLEFRGPGGQSVAPDSVALPVSWSVETGENIAWSVDLPGMGVSSPIVVDGRVIVTAASGADRNRLHVLAFDSMTGGPLWSRQFWATGRTLCYRTSSVAAPTPASDGERVFAFFSSNDLVCLDLDGNLEWIRGLTVDHPGLGNDIGMAASPTVVGDAVVVQCECQTVAFAAAFDKQSGETRWETPRTKSSNWASPLAVPGGVLLPAGDGLTLADAGTGEPLWTSSTDCSTIPSPMAGGDLVLAASGGLTLLKRTGDSLDVVWQQGAVQPGSSSPVILGGRAYAIGRGGILSAADLETGEKVSLSRKIARLGGSFWATPLAADGRLYCINQDGKAFVIGAEGKGELLAECDFGQDIYGSPAAADGGMFVRSHAKLWKIAVIEQADLKPPGRGRTDRR